MLVSIGVETRSSIGLLIESPSLGLIRLVALIRSVDRRIVGVLQLSPPVFPRAAAAMASLGSCDSHLRSANLSREPTLMLHLATRFVVELWLRRAMVIVLLLRGAVL